MTKAKEAAQWMWEELQRQKYLSRPEALNQIEKRFGEDLTYQNDNGNPAIDPAVLRHFRKLHGGRAEYMPGADDYWILG